MRLLLFFSLTLAAVSSAFSDETVTVYRDGCDFLVRSRYSAKQDLVIRNWNYANEAAYLVARDLPMKDVMAKGLLLHINGDEYAATAPLGGYSTLSGNHGSAAASILTVPGHGLSRKDFGGVITDRKNNVYVIMNLPDKDQILIHPEGKNSTVRPSFRAHDGKSELFYNGKKLPFTKSQGAQLYPVNRIIDSRLLADGKTPVPDKTEVKCRFVDFIFVHDVVDPYFIVQSVKHNPGKELLADWQKNKKMEYVHTPELRNRRPEYMKLPALATYYNKYRFEPRGAVVNYRKAVYHATLSRVSSMDIMYGWGGGVITKQKNTWFYIPKLKPLVLKDNRKNSRYPDIPCDLSAVYKIPDTMQMRMKVPRTAARDEKDLPDRYIRVVGDEKPFYGIALGYSLISGCTRKDGGNLERENVYSFRETKKMYPIAYTFRKNPPGKTMETVTFKQYFDPQLEPDATDFLCHYENDSLMVYLDFHKDLKNKTIRLPEAAVGRKITIVEKTPSLTLHTAGKVPPEGISLDVTGKYGYLVLKLD